MKDHVENIMKKYIKNMKEYVENMKKYIKNNYEEIC